MNILSFEKILFCKGEAPPRTQLYPSPNRTNPQKSARTTKTTTTRKKCARIPRHRVPQVHARLPHREALPLLLAHRRPKPAVVGGHEVVVEGVLEEEGHGGKGQVRDRPRLCLLLPRRVSVQPQVNPPCPLQGRGYFYW